MTQSTHIVAGQTAANGSDVAVTAGTPAVFTLDGAADNRPCAECVADDAERYGRAGCFDRSAD